MLAQAVHFTAVEVPLTPALVTPTTPAVDESGNVYAAEYIFGDVKEIQAVNGGISPLSTIRTLSIGFDYPVAVAAGRNGNVYVANQGQQPSSGGTVQEILAVNGSIPTSPTILTLASGLKLNPHSGIAVDGSGNVYIGDTGNNAIKEILAVNGSIPASPAILTLASGFSSPGGVAVDGTGNVFVADSGNNAVKEILALGGYTTVLQLGGTFGFLFPYAVAIDSSGDVYVTSFTLPKLPSTGEYTTILYEIPASAGYSQVNTLGSAWNVPGYGYEEGLEGVAAYGSGKVYLTSAVGLNGPTQLLEVYQATVSFQASYPYLAGSLLFSFMSAESIGQPAVLTGGAANKDFTDAGTGTCTTNGTGYTYKAGDWCTVDVIFTPQSAGTRYGAVVLTDRDGNTLATGYLQGTGVGAQASFPPGLQSTIGNGFISQSGAAVDGSGDVYVTDSGSNTVYKESPSQGGYTQSKIDSGLNRPTGIALDGGANIYIANSGANTVIKDVPSASGGYTQNTVGSGLSGPTAVAVDGSGNVYIADYGNHRVLKETLSADGYTQSTIVNGTTGAEGIAVDGDGSVYLAYYAANTIYKESPSSSDSYIESTLGSGLLYPAGLAVDGNNNVYVADSGSNTVYKETLSSGSYIQTSIADFNTSGMAPLGVAIDGSGNVFVAGRGSISAVKLDLDEAPSLSFATTAVGTTSTDSPQNVTLENIGNALLIFPVPSTGTNPSIPTSFVLNNSEASACPLVDAEDSAAGSLAPGASCQLSISFVPAAVGALSDSLLVTDNSFNAAAPGQDNATQSIALFGTGTVATPSIAVVSSVNPAFESNQVTFTATVSTATETPTGLVSFYDGATLLGSGTLKSGTANYASSSLTPGSHSISAVYSGDTDFPSVTSTVFSQNIETVTLGPSTGSASRTVSPGGQVVFTLGLAPVGGATFAGPVTLSVSGLPIGATAVFSPTTVSTGAGAGNVTLTLTLSNQSALPRSENPLGRGPLLVELGLILYPARGRLRRFLPRLTERMWLIVFGVAVAMLLGGLTACGSGKNSSPQNYTLIVKAASGSYSHTTSLSLTVD